MLEIICGVIGVFSVILAFAALKIQSDIDKKKPKSDKPIPPPPPKPMSLRSKYLLILWTAILLVGLLLGAYGKVKRKVPTLYIYTVKVCTGRVALAVGLYKYQLIAFVLLIAFGATLSVKEKK